MEKKPWELLDEIIKRKPPVEFRPKKILVEVYPDGTIFYKGRPIYKDPYLAQEVYAEPSRGG